MFSRDAHLSFDAQFADTSWVSQNASSAFVSLDSLQTLGTFRPCWAICRTLEARAALLGTQELPRRTRLPWSSGHTRGSGGSHHSLGSTQSDLTRKSNGASSPSESRQTGSRCSRLSGGSRLALGTGVTDGTTISLGSNQTIDAVISGCSIQAGLTRLSFLSWRTGATWGTFITINAI